MMAPMPHVPPPRPEAPPSGSWGLEQLIASIRTIARQFIADNALSLAAAVAFYTALSFGPLVLLAFTFTGVLGEHSAGELVRLFAQELGPQAAIVAENVIETARERDARKDPWRWAAGVVMLLVTASAVFAQLQVSLNRIWRVVARPGTGVWTWLRRRLLSMGVVIAICFLLMVSLMLTAFIDSVVPGHDAWLARATVSIISFTVSAALFAALFKFVPDVRLDWSDVWLGSVVTALLFVGGKAIVAGYLAKGSVGAEYGRAAGGLIALLVWVYYSAILVFIGAEITRHVVHLRGGEVRLKKGAVLAR